MQWRWRFQRLLSRLAPRISATPSPGEPPRTPPAPTVRQEIGSKTNAVVKLSKPLDNDLSRSNEGEITLQTQPQVQAATLDKANLPATDPNKRFPKRVLCVCSGNICRSPYAEVVFRNMAKEQGYETQVFSAGTLKIVGKEAAPLMQRAAAEVSLDLSAHRSNPLSKLLIDASELIFVMSPEHRHEILRIAPNADKKTVMLAHWLSPSKLEIPDPMGLSYDHYRRAVAEINEALARWFSSFEA